MPPDPKLLAFDTSAAHCAVALLMGGEIAVRRFEEMGKGQAERLMPLLEAVLVEAGIGWSDLDRIGVGTGPGNFTGIRISVAAARGLALSLGIPAVGVTGFETVAAQFGKPVALASLPAPRDMAYVQLVRDGVGVGAAAQIDPSEPLDRNAFPLEPGTHVVGHKAHMIAHGSDGVLNPIDPTAFATNIARIAAARPAIGRPKPLYVRPADAAPARDSGPVLLT